ncbi:hypothetical protein AHAS_Ahas12G0216500 [Arachis hypogaea]
MEAFSLLKYWQGGGAPLPPPSTASASAAATTTILRQHNNATDSTIITSDIMLKMMPNDDFNESDSTVCFTMSSVEDLPGLKIGRSLIRRKKKKKRRIIVRRRRRGIIVQRLYNWIVKAEKLLLQSSSVVIHVASDFTIGGCKGQVLPMVVGDVVIYAF